MAAKPETQIEKRLRTLETHLEKENPVLLQVVKSFRELDTVARRLGLLNNEQSFSTRVPWWPVVAVLGTFSAGKSSFINQYLGSKLQTTGNQAVDDRFSVVCFSGNDQTRVLPGVALDADPRFPFYRISQEIEEVSEGEGRRIDAYLQLKTCPSEKLKGKILIDSPGFDADVVDWCLANKVPITPGVSTPTEVGMALKKGLTVLKFFPAEAFGGLKTLKAMGYTMPERLR